MTVLEWNTLKAGDKVKTSRSTFTVSNVMSKSNGGVQGVYLVNAAGAVYPTRDYELYQIESLAPDTARPMVQLPKDHPAKRSVRLGFALARKVCRLAVVASAGATLWSAGTFVVTGAWWNPLGIDAPRGAAACALLALVWFAGKVADAAVKQLDAPELSVLEASRRMRQGMDLTTGTFQTEHFNAWCEALERANGGGS